MKKLLCLFVLIITLLAFTAVSAGAEDTDVQNESCISAVRLSNRAQGVYIKWNRDENAVSYKVMRQQSGGEAELVAENLQKNSCTDTTAVSGTAYTYTVVAVCSHGEAVCFKSADIVYLSQPEYTQLENGPDGIIMSWERVPGARRYIIYFKCDGDTSWTRAGSVGNESSIVYRKADSGKNYTFTLVASDGKYKSSYNKEGKGIFVLSAPEITKAESVNTGIKLKWNKVDGAESYTVYRRQDGEQWSYLTSIDGKKTSFTDTTLLPGYIYYYTLTAVNSQGESVYKEGAGYIYIPVVDVNNVTIQADGLKITWYASPYATGYRLYRKEDGSSSWERIANIKDKDITEYTDKKAENGKGYTYTLITVCDGYKSTYNKQGKTGFFVAAPVATIAVKSTDGYRIEWLKVPGATHYYVYRKSNPGDEWVRLGRVNDVSSCTDKKADRNEKYYYCIRAGINSMYFSDYGQVVATSDIDPNKKMVALTYDDGPHGTYTNKILDVLEQYDARATFFVVGSRIESYNKTLTRAYNMGCEIGNHTYSHINLPSYTNSSILKELDKTDDLVEKYTGERTKIMRPPGGSTNSRVRECVGMPIIMWSVDTRDWEHRNSTRTVIHIKNNVYDGAIVLMHDLYSATASATKTIVPWLIDKGYQLVTVSELMYYRGVNMTAGTIYRSAKP